MLAGYTRLRAAEIARIHPDGTLEVRFLSKRLIDPKDLSLFTSIVHPSLSADGTYVAAVTVQAQADGTGHTYGLYVTQTDGGQATTRSSDALSIRSLAFSPDAKSLAWVEAHQDDEQIKVANVASLIRGDGEIRTVSSAKKFRGSLTWLTDSSGFCVGTADKEDAEIKVYNTLLFKADGVGVTERYTTQLWTISLQGERRQIAQTAVELLEFALAPDGQSVAYTVQQQPGGSIAAQDIHVLEMATGQSRRLFESKGVIHSIGFTPDGKRVVWLGHQGPEWSVTTQGVWLTEVASGASSRLIASFDRPAGGYGGDSVCPVAAGCRPAYDVGADGAVKAVCFIGADSGSTYVYRVDPAYPGTVVPVTPANAFVRQISSVVAGQFLYVSNSETEPDELYLWSHGESKRLTELNRDVREQLVLAEAEKFEFEGADSWLVDGWLMTPTNADGSKLAGPHPLLLVVHGGPHGAFGSGLHWDFQNYCAAGMAVAYVNPRGSQTYGQGFADAVRGDWGGKDYQDLMAFVDKLVIDGVADPERLGVTGYSYGGFMTNWVITHTDRFKAAASGACVSNLVSFAGCSDIGLRFTQEEHFSTIWEDAQKLWEASPLAYVKNVTTPVMMYCAEDDHRCPISQTEEFYTALKGLGKEAILVRYPHGSGGHGFGMTGAPKLKIDRVGRLREWFAERIVHSVVERQVAAAKE